MRAPKTPENEPERLRALHRLQLLDTEAEERFDRLTRLTRKMFGTQTVLISLVDASRQWFKSRQGLDACETGRDISFCGHAILDAGVFEVEDALNHADFADNPLVTGPPYIRFYAGAPLTTTDGQRVGTLCLIDPSPRKLSQAELEALRDFADAVENEIDNLRERQLRNLHEQIGVRSQAILEAIPDMVFVMDSRGHFLQAQDRTDLILPKDQLLGRCIQQVMPPEIADKTQQAITEALHSDRLITFETPFELGDRTHYFEARVRKLNANETLILIRNITCDKAREEALVTNERRLAGVLEGTRIGTWEWNVQTGQTVFNERWAEIVGYTLEELAPINIDTWLSLAHPQDLVESGKLLERHFSAELEFYDFRGRMRHKEGHWVWVHDRGQVITWTDDGKPLMMYGTHADITAEHESHWQLERHNHALSLLSQIALNMSGTFDQQIEQALRLGRTFLKADLGIVSEIIGETYTIDWFSAEPHFGLQQGQCFELGRTYCDLTLKHQGELAIDHMQTSKYHQHPCYQDFGLESYLGIRLELNNETFGTLSFTASSVKERAFDETDKIFLRLLAQWICARLEQQISEDKLDKLVEQAPGMLFQLWRGTNGEMTFPYTSPGIHGIYQLKPEEVREDASLAFKKIHSEDMEAVRHSIDESATTLSDWHAQYRVIQTTGNVRWVEVRSRPERLPDGSILWHGYTSDIHERKQVEMALRHSEALLRGLFEFSAIGIALNDFETGRFKDMNAALVTPSGYTREEFLGLRYFDIIPKHYQAETERALEQLQTSGNYEPFEAEFLRKDGSTYSVRIQGILVRELGGKEWVWSLIEDISERKKVERMKNEFVSSVSHELRTPLTSISGSLGLIVGGALGEVPPTMLNMVSIAQSNSQRLTYLINDLLDMDKLLSGNMTFNLAQHNLGALLQRSIQDNQTYADQYQVSLELTEIPKEIFVCVDRQRLEQVMANLLSNGIKYSPKSGTVRVTTRQQGAYMEISVHDQGPGIPFEFRERIFQKFAQADASDARKKGGTGLGLAITRELVKRMGGDIGFESTPGQHTRFFVHLPLECSL